MTDFSPQIDRSTRLCLAPAEEFEAARFAVPDGACDSHAHVAAAGDDYPMVPERSYTPPAAPEEKYLKMLDANGMSRGVLVQASIYGTDNRYMLGVLRRHPDRLRGIAVVDADVTDDELADMHRAGVRGLRLNVLFGGGIGFEAMEILAERIASLGWHLQFLMDASQLPDLLDRMKELPCRCVIDHMGHMPVALGLDHPGFRALVELVSDFNWWVKLSGANRISDSWADDFADVTPLARELIAAAPNRMVWGSDWPHVAVQRMPDTGRLLNLLATWAPDEETRNQILVKNAAELYDF